MARRLSLLLALLLGATTLALPAGSAVAAHARVSATLTGHVTNASGAVVSGARVRVRAPGSAAVIASATTDGTGDYTLPIDAGSYDVTVLGPVRSGLLARKPGIAVSGTTVVDAVVTAGPITLSSALSVPLPDQSSFRATVELRDGSTLLASRQNVAPGSTVSFTTLPGRDYEVLVEARIPGQTQAISLNSGPLLVEEDGPLPLALPVHPLALSAVDADGPVSATADYRCGVGSSGTFLQAHLGTSGSAPMPNGSGIVYAVDDGYPGSCDITVLPSRGAPRSVTVPHSATTFQVTITPGVHVTGRVTDGLGTPGTPFYVEATQQRGDGTSRTTGIDRSVVDGFYDLQVLPGTHVLSVSDDDLGPFDNLTLRTIPLSIDSDTIYNLRPQVATLQVNVRTPDGTAVAASSRLDCTGRPVERADLDYQFTRSTAAGVDQVLYGGALDGLFVGEGSCTLDVDPAFGGNRTVRLDLEPGANSLVVTVDDGVSVTGHVELPGATTYGASEDFGQSYVAIYRIEPGAGLTDGVSSPIAPDGSFSVGNAPSGHVVVFWEVGGSPGWPRVYRSFETELSADVDDLVLEPAVDPLTVYLLGPDGNDASATLRLHCFGTVGTSEQSSEVEASGTGVVTLPGYAADIGAGCTLVTTFANGLVVSEDIDLPHGGTTITQLSYGAAAGATLPGDPSTSNDADDVPDATEAYAPGPSGDADGNADGVLDYEQADVASLPQDGDPRGSGTDYLTLAATSGSQLEDVSTDDPAPGPTTPELPFGTVSADGLDVVAGSATFEVYPDGLDDAASDVDGWASCHADGTSCVMLPASQVQLVPKSGDVPAHLVVRVVDGGVGDLDGLVNGRVRHTGGPRSITVIQGDADVDPNSRGWFDGPVTITWTVPPGRSLPTPGPTTESRQGTNLTVVSDEVCEPDGGPCSVGRVTGVNIDYTRPVVTPTGVTDQGVYEAGDVPRAGCRAQDQHSGVLGACEAGTVSQQPGRHALRLTATDVAGNRAVVTLHYTVVRFAQPLNATGPISVYDRGATVLVRLPVAALDQAPTWLAPKRGAAYRGKATEQDPGVAGDRGTRFSKRGGYWEFRWSTRSVDPRHRYTLRARLQGGAVAAIVIAVV